MKSDYQTSIKHRGYYTWEELKDTPGVPTEKRMDEGAVAVIECTQEIPCDPCETSCPFDAVKIGEAITNLPRLLEEKCTGCGTCLPECPGLAIFKVTKNYSESTSLVEFPYEYLPLPEKGEIVQCVNRKGEAITEGKIIKVDNKAKNDRTPVVAVEIPKAYCQEVRSILYTGRNDK